LTEKLLAKGGKKQIGEENGGREEKEEENKEQEEQEKENKEQEQEKKPMSVNVMMFWVPKITRKNKNKKKKKKKKKRRQCGVLMFWAHDLK
jgi:hypothetical protein